MTQIVRFRLDDAAGAELTGLRERIRAAGLATPPGPPTVTVAAATSIPAPARAALARELALLTLPSLWLATLATVPGRPEELVLAAIVDAELLAVHAAVHDALAGRVRAPVAAYLPGSWLAHCVLAAQRPIQAFGLLHPLRAVRAHVVAVEIHDYRTGVTARRSDEAFQVWRDGPAVEAHAGERVRPVASGASLTDRAT